MPTPLRRRLRLARRAVFYGAAVVLVLVASLLAVASQLLPLAERHPDKVAAWLSQRAGRPVAFDRVETQWTRRGPLLRLDGLRIGEGAQAFNIGDAEMLVSLYAGVLPGQAFSELRLRGLDLTLERADDGRWKVRGLPGQEQTEQGDPLSALEGLGELQVIDGKLAVIAPSLGVDARVPKIDLRLRVDGDRVRAGARAWPSVGVAGSPSTPLDVVADFDRKRGDGRAYAGATRADLSGWSPLLKVAGIRVESGQGRAEAWADLRGHRIAGVMVSAALDRVGLRAERSAASASVPAALAAAAAPVAAVANSMPGAAGATSAGANQTGASQAGANQAGPNQTGSNQAGPNQAGANGVIANRSSTNRIVANPADAAQNAANQNSASRSNTTQAASAAPPSAPANAAASQSAPPARIEFEHVETLAHYRLTDTGWRLDASKLRIGSGQNVQSLDGLAVAGGERYALRADRIDAGPLIAVAALSDALPERLRHWFETAKPRASLSAIAVNGHRGGPMFASARVDALGFDPVGHSPGLQGLAGSFQADADGFAFDLDENAPMRFDWPSGFGVVHTFKLSGSVGGWREGGGWRVGTTALRIDGDVGVRARGGMWWQGDGSRPWIDIAADLDPIKLPTAKGFWIRSQMSQRLLNWLDTALVAGTLVDAHAVVSGDLDDWPFNHNNGLFHAGGKLRGATVKFQPDWPAVEGLDADIAFVGDGFSVDGSGKIAGVGVRKVQAGIESYHDGVLYVKADTASEASQLLTLLRQSPLHKEHADTLDNLRASGPASVAFDMQLALREGGRTTLNGGVELSEAKLADPRWKVAFEQVRGHADFSRGGFRAEDLDVVHEGAPGKLSLRAGEEFVRDKSNAFEAGLDAMSGADDLISRGPDSLAWLKNYLDGRSLWTVGISIPRSAPAVAGKPAVAAPTMLRLQSNLIGTALTLPPPLNKAAGAALATSVETPLPLGSGDVRVALGNTLALRARNTNNKTGVRVVLGANRVDDLPPANGLAVSGRTDTLEAIDWIALAHGDGSDDSLPLQRIDVTAQRLQLLGGVFPNTRLVVVPAARGATAVRAEGAALEGAVMIPANETGTIAGKFARVHWGSQDAGNAGASAAANGNAHAAAANAAPVAQAAAKPADASMDPAKIPALNIDIAELRFGSAALGSASVRTRPTPAGMRIDQISTRGNKQSIDLSGDWTGRGANARTHLSATVDSGDVGALMSGFGFGGQIGGGRGKARLDAGWPGTPAGIALGSLEGTLNLDMRDGRLIEIEPGAGRMLGLLSVAQLPRRLTLDFRDLFAKGFAFDRVGGTVRFGNGSARSDDLSIDGPAASIAIRGAADLRAQSYDQTIEVRPKAANVLTAVGALAAGPVGAAIGAAANAVLQKPLGSLTSRTYRVTGPWKEPKVEVVTREQTRAEARPAPPAG
ncbi:TIGR02099 family protein [Lysobacter sp. K5869]|uniref:YhdP family protein n=1 Tax=Lysobacter sp. K5869 TaxID=2820808 RepID=UPI001C06348F|nr:YhdP family protein [Lysobacter sp. K5869]QWP74631.1 TIGR02099 family protein [Lysobacter sp. K5869]